MECAPATLKAPHAPCQTGTQACSGWSATDDHHQQQRVGEEVDR